MSLQYKYAVFNVSVCTNCMFKKKKKNCLPDWNVNLLKSIKHLKKKKEKRYIWPIDVLFASFKFTDK